VQISVGKNLMSQNMGKVQYYWVRGDAAAGSSESEGGALTDGREYGFDRR
jgi:hypothetical protein